MGIHMSKRMGGKVGVEPEWEIAYEKACKEDPQVQRFHNDLKAGMGRIINAAQTGMTGHTMTLDFVREVTSWLAGKDEHLKNLILEYKNNKRKNKNLSELFDLYTELNGVTLKFYKELENCLGKAKDNQRLLEIALRCIPPASLRPSKAQYTKCTEKLAEFKAAGNPFNEEFSGLLESVHVQHEQILEKLKATKKKLDRKLKRVRAWLKFSNMVFASAFVTVLICSVVAAVMTAPPLVVALAAVPLIPIFSIGEWLDSEGAKYENRINGRVEIIDTMVQITSGGLFELNQISVDVEKLESIISSILRSVDFCCKDEDNLQVAVGDIRQKQQRFKNQIGNLQAAVEYITDERQSFKDQIKTLHGAVEDIKKMQHSFNDTIGSLLHHVDRCAVEIRKNNAKVTIENIRN